MTEPLEQWAASVLKHEALDAELVAFEYAHRATGACPAVVKSHTDQYGFMTPAIRGRWLVVAILAQNKDYPGRRISKVLRKCRDYASSAIRSMKAQHSHDPDFKAARAFGAALAAKRGQSLDAAKGFNRIKQFSEADAARLIAQQELPHQSPLGVRSPCPDMMADLQRAMRREILNCSKRGTMQ